MIDYPNLMVHVETHPYPLLFATISGAHLYGFPSPDSDFDLRGVHLLPLKTVLGLSEGKQTVEKEGLYDGLEIDLVTHDVSKFFNLLLKRNGYVLEQLLSPLVVYRTPEYEELVPLASKLVTRHHAHHYLGFAATQWNLFEKEAPRRVKPLLYTFRVLLTGIHLMKTGEVKANINILNKTSKLSYLDELVQRKVYGKEQETIQASDLGFLESEYRRLTSELEQAYSTTWLPDKPSCVEQLDELLVRIRLK